MSAEYSELCSVGLPTGESVPVIRRRFAGGGGPRVAIVAGIRGDTPEGVRVALGVASFLSRHHASLAGTVDVYPCVNPLAAARGVRNWPFFDQDLNRRFPGRLDGHAPDQVAWGLVEDVRGADYVLELRGAHPAFSEAAQAQVRREDSRAAALARCANVHVVWARSPGPAAPSTFAWQFPHTIVIEGGTGNRLTPGVGRELTDGVLNLLCTMSLLPDEILPFHWAGVTRPEVVGDERVARLRASAGGLFIPACRPWDALDEGEPVGEVVEPARGQVVEQVLMPARGHVLAVREQPVVVSGTMVARLVLGACR